MTISLRFLFLATLLREWDIPDLGGILIGKSIEDRIAFISLFTPAAVYRSHLFKDLTSALPAVIVELWLNDLDMAVSSEVDWLWCCNGISGDWNNVELRLSARLGNRVLEELIFCWRISRRRLERKLDIGLLLDWQRSHLQEITLLLNLYKLRNNLQPSKHCWTTTSIHLPFLKT